MHSPSLYHSLRDRIFTRKWVLGLILMTITPMIVPSRAQESMLCVGAHWSEDVANQKMKEFRASWEDLQSWEARARIIRQGLTEGMQLETMPDIEGRFNALIHSRRVMDGYVVENIAIESFPGFWVSGNLYTPTKPKDKNPAVLCPHGHAADKRLSADVQIRSAALALSLIHI